MTLRANARIAGVTFLLYIVTAIGGMILFDRASGGVGTAARLASIAQHPTLVRLSALLILLEFLYPVVLAVTIYALTRDQDRDLALVAVGCRFTEGVIAAIAAGNRLDLLSVATAGATATGAERAAANALGALLLGGGDSISATCFALGSTIYCWLFLRARSIPVALAGLGLFASALLVVALPVQIAGFLHGPATGLIWIPMAAFEVTLAVWLIVKGVAVRPRSPSPA
ncbi:MAG TPA: DUF4386 domain-containing protein [Candidatus Eisenbacteria bacterium]